MKKNENTVIDESVKTYPTPKDQDGFFFEDEAEEARGIKTRIYENGNRVKNVTLSNGKVAIVRELTGKEVMEARKYDGGKADDARIVNIVAAIATNIDGKNIVPEDLETFKARDFLKITSCSVLLNLL